jgi:hypothetical protein
MVVIVSINGIHFVVGKNSHCFLALCLGAQ